MEDVQNVFTIYSMIYNMYCVAYNTMCKVAENISIISFCRAVPTLYYKNW